MKLKLGRNQSLPDIVFNCAMIAFSLFWNGFGIYLTIKANIGVSPWDVLNMGFVHTFGILYGTASISVALTILGIDIFMGETIGVAMIIDAFVVGKSVDFFNYIDIVQTPSSLFGSILLMLIGLVIIGYTQYLYMASAMGCGPRDTLLVGLKRIFKNIPIGVVSICMLSIATLVGYVLGGPVGIGTLISAFCAGPIMQKEFELMHFDATTIRHQNIKETIHILTHKNGQ
ncbi:MAG: hypothetical protein HUJ58_09845 [Erysipelotrichaceae bacterium]|nr:hypothetical protein [Erysipelotrichaceae bacterium]